MIVADRVPPRDRNHTLSEQEKFNIDLVTIAMKLQEIE